MLLLLCCQGCSNSGHYRKTAFIPESLSSLYIFSFLNRSGVSELTGKLRLELEIQFMRDGNLAMADTPGLADVALEGEISKLFLQALTRDPTGNIDRARYVLFVKFTLKDIKNGVILLAERTAFAVTFVQLLTVPVTDLRDAREVLVEQISRSVVYYCINGQPADQNRMYGHEDKHPDKNDTLLIGKPRANRDKNNDGVDDRLQNLTNSDGLTNYR